MARKSSQSQYDDGGNDSRRPPQDHNDEEVELEHHHHQYLGHQAEEQQVEYDDLLTTDANAASAYPAKNCCSWKVATLFLVLVATSLVLAWIAFPAEDIVAKYIPEFEAPENPYTGPEAGAPAGNGGITIGMPPSQSPGEEDEDASYDWSGNTVPSFMQCPEDGDATCCNGATINCKIPVNKMMFGMVHNAMSSEEGGFIVGYNHYLELEKALMAGYRGINLDVCSCNGALQFCHNVCDLGERMPNDVFNNTAKFLNDYPSEVIVLLFEASGEQGPIVWNDLYDEMSNIDGFTDMIYVHTYGDDWPTMGSLVEQNKRIIIFYFNGGSCTDDSCPRGFHYFYNHAAETQFESASIDDLENYSYSCEITRGPEEGQEPPSFFAVNNFVTPPDPEVSKVANSRSFLSQRLTKCANINSMRPNFVFIDFWTQGVTAKTVQYANAVHAESMDQE